MGARSMLRPGGRAASPRDAALPEFPHRILLVDDDDGVRRSLERLLASRFRVDAADGAPAARALLSAGFYDVVLCDVMMPRESGVDFFDSLDATSRGQVVFMTGGVLGVELQDRLAADRAAGAPEASHAAGARSGLQGAHHPGPRQRQLSHRPP